MSSGGTRNIYTSYAILLSQRSDPHVFGTIRNIYNAHAKTIAPATFQRVANSLIRELKACCFAYIDDIIVASNSVDEHLGDLDEVLNRILNFGMKLTPDKCSFFQTEVKYLGVLISKNGSRPNPQKVASIVEISTPSNPKAVKSFLGAASYFRRFIPRFAEVSAPLNALLVKNVPFVWKPEHEQAFSNLKQALIQAPLLVPPTLGLPYVIHTDASTTGIGACLLQRKTDTGNEHPIAYGSRALNKHEKNYAIIELEALAVVFALKLFHPYVACAKITVVTDHAPLKSLMHRSDLLGRLAKYQIAIQAHDITIQYRAGKHNTFCDFLSRYPLQSINSVAPNSFPTLEEIRETQICSPYNDIILYLTKATSEFPHEFEKSFENFCIYNNCLYYDCKGQPRLVVPDEQMQTKIISLFHDNPLLGSHHGIQKTFKTIKNKYYWPSLHDDVVTYVTTCPTCQKIKTPAGHVIRQELGKFPIPQRPFERIHTDIIGPLPQCLNGFRFISITVCAFSKFVVCTPLINQTTDLVVKALINDVISKHGIPNELITDRGSNYTSDVFAKLNLTLGITNKFTTSYNHKANGQAERIVKVINDSLTSYCSEARAIWSDFLQPVVFAYNCSINSTTGYSPFFLVHGRHPITWSDVVHELPSTLVFATDSFADQFAVGLKDTILSVGDAIAEKTAKYKAGYDLLHKVFQTELSIGDLVLLHDDTVRPKFTCQWKGPFQVEKVDRPNVTIAALSDRRSRQVVHINRLKLYSSRSTAANVSPQNTIQFQPSLETSDTVEQPIRRSCRLRNKYGFRTITATRCESNST